MGVESLLDQGASTLDMPTGPGVGNLTPPKTLTPYYFDLCNCYIKILNHNHKLKLYSAGIIMYTTYSRAVHGHEING